MNRGLISFLSMIGGAVAGALAIEKLRKSDEEEWKKAADKNYAMMLLFNQWLNTKQDDKSVIDYFHRENIKSIGIYGMGYVGDRLYYELKDSDIEVKYGIDRNADNINSDLEILSPDVNLPDVDVIVVTSIYYFYEIEAMLNEKTDITILSIEDILYEI